MEKNLVMENTFSASILKRGLRSRPFGIKTKSSAMQSLSTPTAITMKVLSLTCRSTERESTPLKKEVTLKALSTKTTPLTGN